MSRRQNRLIVGSAAIALIACATSIIIISRASTKFSAPGAESSAQSQKPRNRHRNLSLKPEALSVSRQLGNRFKPQSRSVSTAVGTVTVGDNQQTIVLVRRQTDTGETVEIQGGNYGLKWSDREPISSSAGRLTDAERLLAERLILDSPDQFVLAQLRGASYFTLARNVRPSDAGDDYDGPLWNLVRLDEPPQQDENLRALSTWRIYYINTQTGLPDRIEYQLNGQDIRTDFVEWNERNGEKTPVRITWSSGGHVIMDYTARNVSHNQ